MISTPKLLLLSIFAVLVESRPQNNFGFPEDSNGPIRRPQQGFRPNRPANPQQFRPTLPGNFLTSQRQQFGNDIPQRPQNLPTTTSQSTTQATLDSTISVLPTRDEGQRIVYLVSCPCQFTYQYSPVCGTDGQTYGNLGVLQCAKACGTNVEVRAMSACVGNRG